MAGLPPGRAAAGVCFVCGAMRGLQFCLNYRWVAMLSTYDVFHELGDGAAGRDWKGGGYWEAEFS